MTVSDFQSQASKTGRTYRDHVANVLQSTYGCTILGEDVPHDSGVQFDLHVLTTNGHEVGIECKAAAGGKRPGMKRSDNVWKVLGYLYRFAQWHAMNPGSVRPRYMVITSDVPDVGTKWHEMLNTAVLHGDLELMVIPYPTLELMVIPYPTDDPMLEIA